MNVFDQFDGAVAPKTGNVFDQFDASTKAEPQDDLIQNARAIVAEPAAQLLSSAIAAPVAGFAGIGQGLKNLISPGMSAADRVEQVQQAMTYQPRTAGGKAVAGAIVYPFEKLAQAGDYVGRGVADSADPSANIVRRPERANIPRRMEGSPLAGAVANTAIQAIPSLLLKGRGKAGEVPANGARSPDLVGDVSAGEAAPPIAAAPVAERGARLAPVSAEAPSKADLKSAARALYKQAEDSGGTIAPESFTSAQNALTADLKKQGLDPTLHPDTTAALKRFSEEPGPITLEKLETLRRIAKDAEGAQRPADQRLASQLVDGIDAYAEGLEAKDLMSGSTDAVQQVKQARDLWSRARKADTLDELVRRAELSAPNFSGSGMENALRTEFRALAKNENRIRLFTAEERAAIEKVAKGGPLENSLRMLGKFAPTGLISAIGGAGAGAAMGGGIGAVALPIAGAIGRLAAKKMTMNNVGRANQLVRRGPQSNSKAAPVGRLRDIGNPVRTP